MSVDKASKYLMNSMIIKIFGVHKNKYTFFYYLAFWTKHSFFRNVKIMDLPHIVVTASAVA